MLELLRHHLQRAQDRMAASANKKRRDVEFAVGDMVYVRFRPHRQSTLFSSRNRKMAPRFFGPFRIEARIGATAYHLQLPASARIHPVFHVSLLKRAIGEATTDADLPDGLGGTDPPCLPEKVLDARTDQREGEAVGQVLVKWLGMDDDEATWMDVADVSASKPVSQGLQQLLLEAEFIIVEEFSSFKLLIITTQFWKLVVVSLIEKERQQAGIYDACGCLWVYLADLRASDRSSGHHNHFYDASKVQEAQAGEIEAHCRNMAEKISELQKEKDIAEAKLRETTSTVASLTDELRNEKLNSSSVRDWARSAKKENVAIKRAIQSLGCKVQFSEDGDCIVGIENIAAEIPQKSLFSIEDMQSSLYMQSDEKPDSLVYVTREEDEDGDSINPINQVCESLCPLRTREGGCRWPEAGCAQFGSQFVGMKENFDAFDRLSIYDSYFQSQ
ncbi:hypothetical protein SASPL_145275 [Salvia splendens]|uniref:Chromo domain-containing protein n=2 Tax=Salvia splendens TaxID=180675 RepID=A0A8X8WHE4_SALSN|nr:hypothetical protein SASPL_145275 [Salvia splendens]